MIIGSALGRLFNGMTLEINDVNVDIKYDYGNQDALDKFVIEMDKQGIEKYPLLFYVTNTVNEFNGWKNCRTNLIIMTNTEPYWLSKERTIETYDNVIEPLYQAVKSKLTTHSFFQILDENPNKYSYDDVPNFGIASNKVGTKTSGESVVTDFVDARVIKLNFRIKTNCI